MNPWSKDHRDEKPTQQNTKNNIQNILPTPTRLRELQPHLVWDEVFP